MSPSRGHVQDMSGTFPTKIGKNIAISMKKLVFLQIDPVFLTPLMQLKVVLDFWHELYSHPFMRVLGYVACRTTSKQLVVGSAE